MISFGLPVKNDLGHCISGIAQWLTEKETRHPRKDQQQDMEIAAAGYLIVMGVMSVLCFIAYGFDKRQASNGGRRVSERTLHLMAFLGGWPGALMGQRQFRQRHRRWRFASCFGSSLSYTSASWVP
jgi:uncharacterized membrane protein YsdA (DUF1294 family)